MLITFNTKDNALAMRDGWTTRLCDFPVPKWGKTSISTGSHIHAHTHAEAYCEEGTPVGVAIATLINRTSVDVTWCYQILIKLLKIACSAGRAMVGGPDSQYPVENSTETAHCCGYRKQPRLCWRGLEHVMASCSFPPNTCTHAHTHTHTHKLYECDARVIVHYESFSL